MALSQHGQTREADISCSVCHRLYWADGPDAHELLVKYYGVTSLSMREALHDWLILDKEQGSVPPMADLIWPQPMLDSFHPSCFGHR